MLTRYACTAAELSCVIGNIFAELSPPCAACGAEVLQITGTTVTGNAATLTVTEAGEQQQRVQRRRWCSPASVDYVNE